MTRLLVRDVNGNFLHESEIDDDLEREHVGLYLRESDTGDIIVVVEYREVGR